MNEFYRELLRQTRRLKELSAVSSLVAWDQETYMPEGGSEARASQLSLLSGLIHEQLTGEPFSRALGRLVDLKSGALTRRGPWTADQRAVLRGVYRRYARARRLPNAHVGALALLCGQAQAAWGQARRTRDHRIFEPFLRKIIELKRRECDYLGYAAHPYDALLDDYEPGATTEQISQLASTLEPLLSRLAAQAAPRASRSLLASPVKPRENLHLAGFCRGLLKDMGFDLSRGRLDSSEHPFTSSFHPSDVRLTLRRNSQGLLDHVFSTLHEGGHALYEQGLDASHWGTPIADPVSMGIHESQSRLWETLVGRGRPFWKRQLPRLAKALPGLSGVSLDRFMESIEQVAPSCIRLDADEVTYNLHIVLRFQLEKALMARELGAKDVPAAWNEKMKKLLGVRPRHDAEGCLQDIHWACGLFGYFPTYLLGNLYAAQFFQAYRRAAPGWARDLERGNLSPLTRWLNRKIHRHGSRFTPAELVQRVTGRPLTCGPFIEHLNERYSFPSQETK